MRCFKASFCSFLFFPSFLTIITVTQPDVLELLFDYGGPPGCMDTVHTLSATIVQLTFRNWWWRGHRGPYSATVAAEWRNIELTFQLSLSQGESQGVRSAAKNTKIGASS